MDSLYGRTVIQGGGNLVQLVHVLFFVFGRSVNILRNAFSVCPGYGGRGVGRQAGPALAHSLAGYLKAVWPDFWGPL